MKKCPVFNSEGKEYLATVEEESHAEYDHKEFNYIEVKLFSIEKVPVFNSDTPRKNKGWSTKMGIDMGEIVFKDVQMQAYRMRIYSTDERYTWAQNNYVELIKEALHKLELRQIEKKEARSRLQAQHILLAEWDGKI